MYIQSPDSCPYCRLLLGGGVVLKVHGLGFRAYGAMQRLYRYGISYKDYLGFRDVMGFGCPKHRTRLLQSASYRSLAHQSFDVL